MRVLEENIFKADQSCDPLFDLLLHNAHVVKRGSTLTPTIIVTVFVITITVTIPFPLTLPLP